MPNEIEIIVKIKKVIYVSFDGSYTVAVAEDDDYEYNVVGPLPLQCDGRTFLLRGRQTVHPKYGEQFKIEGYEEMMPENEEGIIDFLSSSVMKGVGPALAKTIVSVFKEDTLRIIREEPDRLLEVPGIGQKKADLIVSSFMANEELAKVSLFFKQNGIDIACAQKLYRKYGANTIDVVCENPYQAIGQIRGIGFRKADAIARKLGLDHEDRFRIESGIKYVLYDFVTSGHTFAYKTQLCEKAAKLLDVSMESIEESIYDLGFAGDIHVEKLFDGSECVYLYPYYLAEQNICKRLLAINSASPRPITADIDQMIEVVEAQKGIELSANQKHAVTYAVANSLCVITGGPGTGKTTIINAIIQVLKNSGHHVAIAAPTGRAAKRITETSGEDAMTLHRLLEYSFAEDADFLRFGRNAENPLQFDAVIVDEASMIDLLLMNGLVTALKPGTRLILVGDADQLPSVGAGNVLSDIIESEFGYCVRLTQIFRQAKESLIVVNAHRINKGEYPEANDKENDFFFLKCNTELAMLETIKDLCIKRLPEYMPELVPIRDIQVLTPIKGRGKNIKNFGTLQDGFGEGDPNGFGITNVSSNTSALGVVNVSGEKTLGSIRLNKELQALINPPRDGKPEKKIGDRIFRAGDKVMQIRNNYTMKWRKLFDGTDGEGVFNGDMGIITTIDNEQSQIIVCFDEDKYVIYDYTTFDELEHAYAVTVHKSQGSEFPVVVMPISYFPQMLATRNLLYTAVTRGKQLVVLVGSERHLKAMIDNCQSVRRNTGLCERLKKCLSVETI